MTAHADSRLPLTILGGFLGSGKTTLLERAYRDPRTEFIVNDTGTRSPDLTGGVHALLGGCACCERLDDLVDLLRGLCNRRHLGTGPARAVLETSGLADPARILEAIEADPVLASNVVIADTTITVDAERGLSDLTHEPLARIQVEQADTVVVAKADLVDGHELSTVLATVASVNPGARLEVRAFGQSQQVPSFDVADAVALPAATELAVPKSAWIPVPGTVDWTVLVLWLGALVVAYPHQILRVKGLLNTPRSPVVLHAARGTVGLPTRVNPEVADADCGLLFVTRDLDPDVISASWTAHRNALSSAT
ncbi:MAG: GTP-binding protein [Gordonia sp. (in: high G+C Gram-positive bacteria)]|uniref:CobW family GTP-binding protein n=1 Tax=Gordonia sp. (in: high G+C Gram-positive bacteria) TaxID=84139 RepID=UPI003C7250F7